MLHCTKFRYFSDIISNGGIIFLTLQHDIKNPYFSAENKKASKYSTHVRFFLLYAQSYPQAGCSKNNLCFRVTFPTASTIVPASINPEGDSL